MKRLALAFAAVACAIGWYRHRPRREPIGGLRCETCGKPGASLDDFGGVGYVSPIRRLFSRGRGEGLERIAGWGEPERADRPSVDSRFRRGRQRRPA